MQTRTWLVEQAEQAKQVRLKRADFVTNRSLLNLLGVTICLCYVVFAAGSRPQAHTSPQLLHRHSIGPGHDVDHLVSTSL
jgi:hypothetical protein